VDEGFAVTGELVDALRFVDGVQVYEFAPLAESVVDCPTQMTAGGVTVTTGSGLTITVTCAVAVQPLASVPVTV